ncbi:hypothetical protein T484DRAFT_1774884, partial [Baffinella frigidus]
VNRFDAELDRKEEHNRQLLSDLREREGELNALQAEATGAASECLAMEAVNSALQTEVEALRVRVAQAGDLQILADNIDGSLPDALRQSREASKALAAEKTLIGSWTRSQILADNIDGSLQDALRQSREAAVELAAEKSRTRELELEVKGLQHKLDVVQASTHHAQDLKGLQRELQEMLTGAQQATDLLHEEMQAMKEHDKTNQELAVVVRQVGQSVEEAQGLSEELEQERHRASLLQRDKDVLQKDREELRVRLDQRDKDVLQKDREELRVRLDQAHEDLTQINQPNAIRG